MNQRRVSADDLRIVLNYGRWFYRAGVKFIFLGNRDLPAGLARQYDYLVGTTVLLQGEDVITVYKNKDAVSDIKRKWKRNTKKRW